MLAIWSWVAPLAIASMARSHSMARSYRGPKQTGYKSGVSLCRGGAGAK